MQAKKDDVLTAIRNIDSDKITDEQVLEQFYNAVNRSEFIDGVKRGLEDVRAGRVMDFNEAEQMLTNRLASK